MKKKNVVVSLTAVAALLCVGGAFALNANTTVSAEDTKQQIMLGASILVANEQTGLDSNGIRFPVVVADSVAEKITASKTYVLPAEFWDGAVAPTATEIIAHAKTVASDTSDKWVNYYEENAGYGDDYQEAVVYMYNIPDDKYATDFYVCAWMQLDDSTTEISEVVCRSMQDVAVAAVESGVYSTEQLGKYLTETTYTVNHYLRTIYGNYVQTGEATTVESYVGFTATGDEVDGYTYNANLTKEANDSLIVAADNATTINCYYENDEYTFNKLYLNNGQDDATTITREGVSIISEVADLAETDYRGNVIKYVAPGHVATNVQTMAFNSNYIGKYMLFNAYFTGTPTTGISEVNAGFVAYSNSSSNSARAKGIYNQEGKLYATSEITTANESGKWITFAHYVDPALYNANGQEAFVITFAMYHGCTAYLGEWLLVSPEVYKANFEQRVVATTSVEGVTAYAGNKIVNVLNEGGVVSDFNKGVSTLSKNSGVGPTATTGTLAKINGVSSFAAGSYVAIRMYAESGHPIKMYEATSKEIYDDEGIKISCVAGNNGQEIVKGKWYTFVFYFETSKTVSTYVGTFYLDNYEKTLATYSEVYIISNATAYEAFKAEKGLSANGITYYEATKIVQQRTDGGGSISKSGAATITYTTSASGWDSRTLKLNGVTGYTANTYLVLKLYYTDIMPSAYFYGGSNRTWYNANREKVSIDSTYKAQWVYVTWKVAKDITSINNYNGVFMFGDGAVANKKIKLECAYVMTEAGYNTYFGLN